LIAHGLLAVLLSTRALSLTKVVLQIAYRQEQMPNGYQELQDSYQRRIRRGRIRRGRIRRGRIKSGRIKRGKRGKDKRKDRRGEEGEERKQRRGTNPPSFHNPWREEIGKGK
jgi:hypothetical protein